MSNTRSFLEKLAEATVKDIFYIYEMKYIWSNCNFKWKNNFFTVREFTNNTWNILFLKTSLGCVFWVCRHIIIVFRYFIRSFYKFFFLLFVASVRLCICYRLVRNTQFGPCGNGALKTERVPFQKDIYFEIEFFLLISFRFLFHFFVHSFCYHISLFRSLSTITTQENWCKRNGNDKMCFVASNFGWFDLEISSNTRSNRITLFLFIVSFFFIIQVNSGFFSSFFFSLGVLYRECVCRNALHTKASWNNLLIHYRMENMFGMRLHLM